MTKVKLSDIIDAMNFQGPESSSYINTKTGEVVTLSGEEINAAEDNESVENFPDWQRENIKIAKQIIRDNNPDYLELADDFDIDEYRMMEKFTLSLQDDTISEKLYLTIKGSGAFRRFKAAIDQFGLTEKWHNYRDTAYKELAIEWCSENNINYINE